MNIVWVELDQSIQSKIDLDVNLKRGFESIDHKIRMDQLNRAIEFKFFLLYFKILIIFY